MEKESPITEENQELTDEKVNKIVESLTDLRDNWSEEIPHEQVNGSGFYKVRKNWFTGVLLALRYLETSNLYSDDLKAEIKKFSEYIVNDKFKKRMTTREDIDMTNQLIDHALAEINGR